MEPITTRTGLKNAIQALEVEQANKGQLLKEQFYITYEGLKPINIIKSTLNEVTTSPYFIDNILGTTLGLASGFLSKKLVVGASGSIVRKIIGSAIQFGITNLVAQNADSIKSFGQNLFQHIFHKKETNVKNRDS